MFIGPDSSVGMLPLQQPNSMKHFSAFLLACAITFNAQAQVIFQDDFESWTLGLPDNWVGAKTNISVDSIEQVTVNAQSGSSACRLKNSPGGHKRFTTDTVTVVNGASYTVTFWVRGAGEVRTGLFDGRPGGSSGYSAYNSYVVASSAWAQVTQSVTCANDTTGAEFIISLHNSAAPEHVVIDNVQISLPGAPVAATIHDIQFTTDPGGSSPMVGDSVITGGIVTAQYSGGYWIQSGSGAWSGIFVNDTNTVVAVGDSVSVTGIVQESFGLTRIGGISSVAVTPGFTVPASTNIDFTQSQSEDFESVLCTAVSVTCSRVDAGFGEWVVNYAGPTDSLRVDDLLFAFVPSLGFQYTLTGPMYYSFGLRKIEPRSAGDIVAGINDLNIASLTFGPNPASDQVTIQRASNGVAQVVVLDASGRTVIDQRSSDAEIMIDVHALNAGMYTVQMIESNSVRAAKLNVVK